MTRSKKAIEQEKDLEKLLEGLNEKSGRPFRRRKKKVEAPLKTSSLIIGLSGAFLFWLISQNLPGWGAVFITKNYEMILPVLKIALIVFVFGNFLLLFCRERKFKNTVRILQNVFSFIFIYKVYSLYPFSFSYLTGSSVSDFVARAGLIAILAGLGAMVIMESLEFFLEK